LSKRGDQVAADGLPVPVGRRELQAAAGEVLLEPALAEAGEGDLLRLAVAVALDVDNPSPQLSLGALAIPPRLAAERFEHPAAGGVAVADPPNDAALAVVAPDAAPFALGRCRHCIHSKLSSAQKASPPRADRPPAFWSASHRSTSSRE